MAGPWDAAEERECHALVVTVCDEARALAERNRAWQALLTRIAPRVEVWARRSSLLRRTRLVGEDEARAVLVDVIARLRDREFANLKAYLGRNPGAGGAAEDSEEAEALEALTKFVEEDAAEERRNAAEDVIEGTPLRGWLANLTRYAVKDHVKRRFAYAPDAPEGAPNSKRLVNTGADRLDKVPERGTRPPLTDLLAMKKALGEIREFMNGLPAGMKDALGLWLNDESFEVIAGRVGVADAAAARNLVRAGQARLRERFRGEWPELFGS